MKQVFKILIFLLSLFSLFVTFSCSDSSKTDENQNDEEYINSPTSETNFANISGIKNYSSIKAIGVGYLNNNFNSRAVEEDQKSVKLIAVTDEEIIETVIFYDDEGNEIEQQYNISDFISLKNFSIFRFTSNQISEVGYFSSVSNTDSIYVLYKKTGKIYELTDFTKFAPSGFTRSNDYRVIEFTLDETEDSIYFYGQKQTDTDSDYLYIYQFKVQDDTSGELKMILDCSKFKNWGSGIIVDKYGNIYSWSFSSENKKCTGLNYCITTNGELKTLPSNCYKAINELVYDQDNNVMNSEGNFVLSSFIPPSDFYVGNGTFLCFSEKHQQDFIVLQEENTVYYYLAQPNYNNSAYDYNSIYKITFDENRFSYDKINLDTSFSNNGTNRQAFVVTNGRIYFIQDESIFYIDIKNGSKTVIDSSYYFNSIYTDNLGNVFFTALDNQLNDVVGKISEDNSIDLNISENNYTVLTISPLN